MRVARMGAGSGFRGSRSGPAGRVVRAARGAPEAGQDLGKQLVPVPMLCRGGLVRGLATGGLRDLLRVDVDRQHLVPEVGQANGVGKPEVSGPDDGDPRQLTAPPLDGSKRY